MCSWICASEETLTCLHGPAGLTLGAQTSAEIALSIIAQMQALHLRDSE